MGWSDYHLHQFRIHGKRYGICRIGGISFSDDPHTVRLKDLRLRINERFYYEYDFTDDWQHLIRVEATLAPEPHRHYPVCIDGRRIDEQLGEERVFFIDGCPMEWEKLPSSGPPITVGMDGSYVRDWRIRKAISK